MTSALDPNIIKSMSPETMAIVIADDRFQNNSVRDLVIARYDDWLKSTDVSIIAKTMSNMSKDPITKLHRASGAIAMYDLLRFTAINKFGPNDDTFRTPDSMFLTMMDVEAINLINHANEMSHQRTDTSILRPLGSALLKSARKSDVASRKGGDEFVVFGLARNSFTGPMPKIAKSFGRRVLANMLDNSHFVGTSLNSLGLVLKTAQFDPSFSWEQANNLVDAKEGLVKHAYNYSDLTEGATLQRIYKGQPNPWGLGYLNATNEGGIFVKYNSIQDMKTELLDPSYEFKNAGTGYIEIDITNVPSPDIY